MIILNGEDILAPSLMTSLTNRLLGGLHNSIPTVANTNA